LGLWVAQGDKRLDTSWRQEIIAEDRLTMAVGQGHLGNLGLRVRGLSVRECWNSAPEWASNAMKATLAETFKERPP